MEEVLRDQVRDLVRRMEMDRKQRENAEDYEFCAAARDGIGTLSDYALGYIAWPDAEETLLFWIQYYGKIINAEDEAPLYYVTYMTEDPHATWVLSTDRSGYLAACDILEEIRKKRRKR